LTNNVILDEFCAGIRVPEPAPLEVRETTLERDGKPEHRACFLRLMGKMLQWEPEKRASAKELAEDEWIVKHTS
jgi:serine/threonine-protein kinase SRPK3